MLCYICFARYKGAKWLGRTQWGGCRVTVTLECLCWDLLPFTWGGSGSVNDGDDLINKLDLCVSFPKLRTFFVFSKLVPSFENGITRLVTDAWLRSPITGVSLYSLPLGEVWAGRCSVFYTIRAPFGQQDPNSTNIRRQPMSQAVISNYEVLKIGWDPFSMLPGQHSQFLWCSMLSSFSRQKLFQFLHNPLADVINSNKTFIMRRTRICILL